jgi:hypothetical protein
VAALGEFESKILLPNGVAADVHCTRFSDRILYHLRLGCDLPVIPSGVRHRKLTRVGVDAWTLECQTIQHRSHDVRDM